MNALAIASDPSTPPQKLRALAQHANVDVRCAVAANANTPAETLFELAAEFPRAFLGNALYLLLLLEDPGFPRSMPAPAMEALLTLEDLPREVLEQAAYHFDHEVRRAATRHRRMPGELVVYLARNYYFYEEAALHPNTSPEYVAFLCTHPWASIRALMTTRPGLDRGALERLADDDDAAVRLAAKTALEAAA
jgi:hypothetical protein